MWKLCQRFHPSGKFLMMKAVKNAGQGSTLEAPRKIDVVLNWYEELKQRAPAK
jgi:hypothetical protein